MRGEKDSMRVLLVSTHVDQTTGYSKVAYHLLRQMATLIPKIKLFHFGFQRNPGHTNHRKVPEGVIAFDAAAAEDPKEEGFGFNKLAEYIETVEPKLVIFYNDPLIIARFLDVLKYDKEKASYKVWTYLDQVYLGIARPVMEAVDKASEHVYAFTPYWADVYRSYFPDGPQAKVKVLEHAADAETFKPLANRSALRAQLNLPENATVFLNCNRNSQRKRLDLTIQAFVGLLAKNPEAPYYLLIATGADPTRGGHYNLQNVFCTECQIHNLNLADVGNRLLVIDTGGTTVYTDSSINDLYNVADLGINTSDGEGFGLCQLEHLQTGAPQIVTDAGSYTFLDETCAITIPAPLREYQSGTMVLGTFARTSVPDLIIQGMEKAIADLPKLREGIAAKTFPTWANVCDGFLEDLLAQTKN